MPSKLSKMIAAAFFLASHAAAYALYAGQREDLGLPSGWDLQFLILVAVSFGLSLAVVLLRVESPRAKAASVLSALCCLLAGLPLPLSSGVQIALGLAAMIEMTIAFPMPDCFVVGSLALVSFTLFRRGGLAWGRTVPEPSPALVASLALVLAFAFASGLAIKELEAARRRAMVEVARLDAAIDEISAINASFQAALASAEEASALKERNRITREIHDIVGYALTNQQMMLEAALLLVGPGEGRLRELLTMARAGVAEGLRETRGALYELRETGAGVEEAGLGLLLSVVRNFESVTGVRVSVDFTNARCEVGKATWLSLYRIVQESMINAFRHGRARRISIIFREDSSSVYVLVRDDGCGSPVVAEGIGLKGMRERVAAAGGDFFAGSQADGFAVSARLPKEA